MLQKSSLLLATSDIICLILNSLQVHRFLVQVATDNIALTGLNFFPVTRTVLLTVSIAGIMQVLFAIWVYTAAVAHEPLTLAKHSDVAVLYAEHHKIQLIFVPLALFELEITLLAESKLTAVQIWL